MLSLPDDGGCGILSRAARRPRGTRPAAQLARPPIGDSVWGGPKPTRSQRQSRACAARLDTLHTPPARPAALAPQRRAAALPRCSRQAPGPGNPHPVASARTAGRLGRRARGPAHPRRAQRAGRLGQRRARAPGQQPRHVRGQRDAAGRKRGRLAAERRARVSGRLLAHTQQSALRDGDV